MHDEEKISVDRCASLYLSAGRSNDAECDRCRLEDSIEESDWKGDDLGFRIVNDCGILSIIGEISFGSFADEARETGNDRCKLGEACA